MPLMFPKSRPLALDRADKKRAQQTRQRDVYRAVEQRDGFKCRACGKRWQKGTDHHHHLTFRSQGGKHESRNVLLLCTMCHGLVHTYRLVIVGTNADRRLRFERTELAKADN